MIHEALKSSPRHGQLIQRFVLLLTIFFIGTFFSKHRMIILVVLLMPLFYLFTRYPTYKRINTAENIEKIANSIPEINSEPANCMSIILALLWPHMFSEERVSVVKENMQWYLDRTPIPYFKTIQLQQLTIGDLAPQILQISICKRPAAPKHSVLLKMEANYFPSFNLTSLLIPSGNFPPFNVSFTDLAIIFETYILIEFTPDPWMNWIPLMTSVDFCLVKPPDVRGFNITLFQSNNLINKDIIKTHLKTALSTMMFNTYGTSSNAFVWDKITGEYRSAPIKGSHGLTRASLPFGHLKRINNIKTQALEYCRKLCIAEPLTILTTDYKDSETTTFYKELFDHFISNKTIETFSTMIEEFTVNAPTGDELITMFEPSHLFFKSWYNHQVTSIASLTPERGRRKGSLSQEDLTEANRKAKQIDKAFAPMYNYINFLNMMLKVHPVISERLNINHISIQLQNQILALHDKIVYKMSS